MRNVFSTIKRKVKKMYDSIVNNNTFPERDDYLVSENQFEDETANPELEEMFPKGQAIIYEQWFEKDPIRLNHEIKMLNSEFPNFECLRMNDGRIAFNGKIEKQQICVICNYNYPLKPPDVFIFDIEINFVDEEGKINIFQETTFIWNSNNTYVVNVLRELSNFLKMYFRIKETKKEKSDSGSNNEQSTLNN